MGDDLDVVMRDGLGLRFAFMGPMETIHLNAMGLKKYCETYGETIYNVSKTMGDIPSAWLMRTEEDKTKIEKLDKQMTDLIPLEKHEREVPSKRQASGSTSQIEEESQRVRMNEKDDIREPSIKDVGTIYQFFDEVCTCLRTIFVGPSFYLRF